uniref:Uncharacterized protein n=1 Tax=Xenopus tropicalis TaxID=8364 RepID=A0A6I8PU10_XENTR
MCLWMAFLLSCITVTECTDSSETQQQVVLVAVKQIEITFPSNFKDNKESRVSLLRGVKKSITVCSGSFNSSYQSFESNAYQSIRCIGIPTENKITFHLSGLTENHTDIYFFRKEDMYPPPYTCYQDNGTVIHVKGMEHPWAQVRVSRSSKGPITTTSMATAGCYWSHGSIQPHYYCSILLHFEKRTENKGATK